MERINTLLDKIRELNTKKEVSIIDIDLMTDYVKVIYADLLEWRNKISFNNAVTIKHQTDTTRLSETGEENIALGSDATTTITEPLLKPSNIEDALRGQTSMSFLSAQPGHTDIRKRIGVNDKYQFISELFSNNKEAYEDVITEVNTFETEEEAIAWLNNNISNQFNWQDDSETVQTFYMLLSDHFDSQ